MNEYNTINIKAFYLASKQFINDKIASITFQNEFGEWLKALSSDLHADLIMFESVMTEDSKKFDFSFGTSVYHAGKIIPEKIAKKLSSIISNFNYTYRKDISNYIGIEFDSSKNTSQVPSVFLHPEPFVKMCPSILAKYTFDLFESNLISSLFEKNIANIFHLSEKYDGEIRDIGFMLPRQIPGLKISIAFKSTYQKKIELICKQLGFEGRTQELNEYINLVEPFVDQIGLALDFGNIINPRFCIICWGSDWEKIFTALIKRGLILPDKALQVQNWFGYHGLIDEQENYTVFSRNVRILKFVFSSEKKVSIKIYLRAIIQSEKELDFNDYLRSFPITDSSSVLSK